MNAPPQENQRNEGVCREFSITEEHLFHWAGFGLAHSEHWARSELPAAEFRCWLRTSGFTAIRVDSGTYLPDVRRSAFSLTRVSRCTRRARLPSRVCPCWVSGVCAALTCSFTWIAANVALICTPRLPSGRFDRPMTIFNLHSAVLADYRDFVRSFFMIAEPRTQEFVNRSLVEEGRLWPDFLLQVSPSYTRLATVDELAAQGQLRQETASIFRTTDGQPFHLYQHQVESLQQARTGQSYIVTSGTGSGKSLTYFLPITESLLAQPATGDRVAALVVYPMNALVNSQLQALEKLRDGYERRTGRRFPITFAKYTGESDEAVRSTLRLHPPQILLTNYVMAELMLVRPEDQRFLDRAGGGLRFLVFDELHTYRGRQGADVAMLIRRLKERCAAPNLVHVGTSATMVANRDATPLERRATVADFAQRLFGHPFTADQIIEETLVTFTEPGEPSRAELAAALTGAGPNDAGRFPHASARALGRNGVRRRTGGGWSAQTACPAHTGRGGGSVGRGQRR